MSLIYSSLKIVTIGEIVLPIERNDCPVYFVLYASAALPSKIIEIESEVARQTVWVLVTSPEYSLDWLTQHPQYYCSFMLCVKWTLMQQPKILRFSRTSYFRANIFEFISFSKGSLVSICVNLSKIFTKKYGCKFAIDCMKCATSCHNILLLVW